MVNFLCCSVPFRASKNTQIDICLLSLMQKKVKRANWEEIQPLEQSQYDHLLDKYNNAEQKVPNR